MLPATMGTQDFDTPDIVVETFGDEDEGQPMTQTMTPDQSDLVSAVGSNRAHMYNESVHEGMKQSMI